MTTFIETLNHSGDQFLKLAWPVLWQSSLLIAVIFVLEIALRRKVRAAIRYALWLMVLVKLLLPPTLALPTSPTWWIHPAVPPPVKAPPVSFTVSYGEQITPDFPMAPPPIIPPKPPSLTLAAWAIILSSVVSASLFVWLLVRWRGIMQTVQNAFDANDLNDRPNQIHAVGRASRLSLTLKDRLGALFFRPRQSSPKREGNFADGDRRDACPTQAGTRAVRLATAWNRLIDSARLTRLRPGIRLKLTEDSMSPAVCGLFRPVILLPQSLVEKLSAGQLRAVLLHEAIHLRRGDVWVNCAQALLQIIYWWHPLFWLANARIRRVREEAVDDAVMLALRDDAEIYAPTLLEVAKLAFNRPLASLGLIGILESRSALRQRIERLVNFNAPKKAGLTVVSILGILAFSAVALPMGEAPTSTNESISAKVDENADQTNSIASTATNSISDSENKSKAGSLVQDGKLLYEMGKFDDAEAKLNAALVLNPDNQAAHYYLALIEQSRQARTSGGRKLTYPRLDNSLNNLSNRAADAQSEDTMVFQINQPMKEDDLKKHLLDAGVKIPPTVFFFTSAGILLARGSEEQLALVYRVVLKLNRVSPNQAEKIVSDFTKESASTGVNLTATNLEMRIFKLDGYPVAALRATPGLQTNNVATMAESLFNKLGVDLTAPGRSLAYNDKLGLLFVKATPSELDTIERIIQGFNQFNPQIHIKATIH